MIYPSETDIRTNSNGKRYLPYTNKKGTVEFLDIPDETEDSIEESHARQKEPEEQLDWSQYMEGGMGDATDPDGTPHEHQRSKDPVMVYLILTI